MNLTKNQRAIAEIAKLFFNTTDLQWGGKCTREDIEVYKNTSSAHDAEGHCGGTVWAFDPEGKGFKEVTCANGSNYRNDGTTDNFFYNLGDDSPEVTAVKYQFFIRVTWITESDWNEEAYEERFVNVHTFEAFDGGVKTSIKDIQRWVAAAKAAIAKAGVCPRRGVRIMDLDGQWCATGDHFEYLKNFAL